MIKLNEGKTIDIHQKVECYRNLHKGAFSIRDKKTKRVIAIGDSFILGNVTTRISEKSRLRVIEQRQKNVHSWLTGEYKGTDNIDISNLVELYYNPYKYDSFIRLDNMKAVYNINCVYFKNDKCYIVN